MKQDVISLKKEQFNRYRLIQEVIDGQLTAKDAAEELNLSTRQIQRLKKKLNRFLQRFLRMQVFFQSGYKYITWLHNTYCQTGAMTTQGLTLPFTSLLYIKVGVDDFFHLHLYCTKPGSVGNFNSTIKNFEFISYSF